MVDVRFELTTNDPWSVDDAICEGISPLGYWQKVNRSPTQTKRYNKSKFKQGNSSFLLPAYVITVSRVVKLLRAVLIEQLCSNFSRACHGLFVWAGPRLLKM